MKRLNEKQWRDETQREGAMLLKAVDTVVTESDEERILNFRISTETPDSYKDVIKADGWDLERFKKNPVVLWAHDHRQPPVGQALAVEVDGEALVASAEFADAETYAFADTVFRLLKKGFLRATSVGFFPQEWTYDEDRGGFNFVKQELFEFSIVPVPANPDALALALKSGIDCAPLKEWAEKTLDMWNPEDSVALWIPRAQIEEIHRSLNVDKVVETVVDAPVQLDLPGTVTVPDGSTAGGVPPQSTTSISDHTPDVWYDGTTGKRIDPPNADPVGDGNGDPVARDFDVTIIETEENERMREAIESMSDQIESLTAQIDQMVAKIHKDEKAAQDGESADELSEVIDLSFQPEDVENEADRAIFDLDIDPEKLQQAIRSQLEKELMKTTGKLPKEV